jgi:hypothetical protein
MFTIVVCLEQRNSQIQLEHYTPEWDGASVHLNTKQSNDKHFVTHPIDQTSHGWAQPNSNMTSGAR